MADLVPVHGGLAAPVDRTVPADRIDVLRKAVAAMPVLRIDDADLSSLYRFGDGALSPLTGPMNSEQWNRSLDHGVVQRDGKNYAWTIPISFPITKEEATSIKSGVKAQLQNARGEFVGMIAVNDVFPYDKAKYIKGVYQTERTDHPGGKMVMSDSRELLVGGDVDVLPQPVHPDYGQFVLRPTETRKLFAQKGWTRVVAFQTRNPLHRAHEYALVYGLEQLVRRCDTAGAVLNPLIGETKSDDVDAATRMRTYRALIENKALGQGDSDEKLWATKSYKLTDRVILLGLDIKMFYAGPKEAVMHGVYRQNYGFTDIVIGRKHADAPYDDGKDIWDGLAAQRIFDNLPGELHIKPVKVGFAAYYESVGRVDLVENHADEKPVSISGREVREQLIAGKMPDPRIMRPETAKILIEKMHK
ncbi:MAG: sulfate adenylyltransferase [Planctomycetia bacterium]|jgi:sulfate adenylyltransferase|nr:sulfate adenylyltransferase [Planctomycetia bacterium]MCC7315821.1 sulfate adenylyltransferase [Planctomycetota bacterium]OQY96703.1 MAG: sulfate adenylyltransferase [Planctomycetes bacterium UTPLA1]